MVSEVPDSGKNLMWMLMKIVPKKVFKLFGTVVLVTPKSKMQKRFSLLTTAKLIYEEIGGEQVSNRTEIESLEKREGTKEGEIQAGNM